MLYGVGWQLFHSQRTAFASALLFGVSPLSNQTIVASSWTNTAAYALLLSALFLFLHALRAGRKACFWLSLALVLIWADLFIYEGTVVIFVFVYTYLAIEWWSSRRQPITSRLLLFLTLGSALAGLTFFAARFLFVSAPTQMARPLAIVKSAVMYGGALLVPIDSVLAHQVFETPLPPEIPTHGRLLAVLFGLGCGMLLLAAPALYFLQPLRSRLRQMQWPTIGYLVFCCCFSLFPFLFFTEHASETYLYLPAAFYALLLTALLRTMLSDSTFRVVVAFVTLLYGAGTWLRNEDVTACGTTAKRILSGLPIDNWRQGSWHIRAAAFPGESARPRFGIYRYQGLSTIDVGDPKMSAFQSALQLATLNPLIAAQVVSPTEMRSCFPAGTCFWVHQNGQVEAFDPMREAIE